MGQSIEIAVAVDFIYSHGNLEVCRVRCIHSRNSNASQLSTWIPHHVWIDHDDPGRVVVLLEWDTLENARRFAHSDTYLEARQRAGVIEPAEFTFLDRTENLEY